LLARCLCALTFFIAAYSARRTNCKACSAKSVWQRVPGAGLPRARRVRHSSKPARPGTAGTSRAGAGAGGAGARSCGHIGKRCRGAGQQAAAPAAPMLLGARHFARGQYCRARVTSREANATLQPRASGRGSLRAANRARARTPRRARCAHRRWVPGAKMAPTLINVLLGLVHVSAAGADVYRPRSASRLHRAGLR